HPVHVVLRVTPDVGSLRTRHAYRAVRRALATTAARADFRVVHLSLQRTHLHLLVEADHKLALTRGMQGFAISAAKRLNRALLRRRGNVFPFRYHPTPITTPTQARNALSYVLNNWRHHRANPDSPRRIAPFSSADPFAGWSPPPHHAPPTEPLPVVAATAWLLTDGWSRAGPIDFAEIPGPDPTP